MKVDDLSKPELRAIYDHLCRTGNTPFLTAIASKIQRNIMLLASEVELGARVFTVDVPFEVAPTLNRYGSLKGWQREKVGEALDVHILAALKLWPRAVLTTPRRRFARVTRFSTKVVDEISVDIVGGKMPIDRLVQHRVLWGDSARELAREARCLRAPPGRGKVTIEIFETIGPGGLAPAAKSGGTRP